MINNLRSFLTAKAMLDHKKVIYDQNIAAKRFQLELDIANYLQGTLSIQDFYSDFLNLWVEPFEILHVDVPKTSLAVVQNIYEVSKRGQFLMKLSTEFEVARAALLNRNPVPDLEVFVGELFREVQRLLTQNSMSHDQSNPKALTVAYSTQNTVDRRDTRHVQCFSCKQFGHIARSCTKKVALRNSATTASNVATLLLSASQDLLGVLPTTHVVGFFTHIIANASDALTPEKVQQIVLISISFGHSG